MNSKSDAGYSLIEMLIAMMLLVIFGLGIFVLAASATTTYENLVEEKQATEDARIGMSYLVTKLRQNDRVDAVRVAPLFNGSGDALVIRELFEGERYETWIYVNDGYLREATITEDMVVSDDLSFEIAKAEGLKIGLSNKTLTFTLTGIDQASIDSVITLKSEIATGEQ